MGCHWLQLFVATSSERNSACERRGAAGNLDLGRGVTPQGFMNVSFDTPENRDYAGISLL